MGVRARVRSYQGMWCAKTCKAGRRDGPGKGDPSMPDPEDPTFVTSVKGAAGADAQAAGKVDGVCLVDTLL